jgi:hypothetical protein
VVGVVGGVAAACSCGGPADGHIIRTAKMPARRLNAADAAITTWRLVTRPSSLATRPGSAGGFADANGGPSGFFGSVFAAGSTFAGGNFTGTSTAMGSVIRDPRVVIE